MAVNTCEMWSNGIKIAFFSKNLQKPPTAGGFAPRPHSHRQLGATPPQTPVCDTFEYTNFLNKSPKLDISFFNC